MDMKELKQLLKEMSLEEKIGQMIQITGSMLSVESLITGPTETIEISKEMLSMVGSILNIEGADKMREIQEQYVKNHPHHIPLLFMYDVINGMETIFPIPLAQGCTFSTEMVEQAACISSREAAASGLHVTFSPMQDLVRDPRWGRVMEGTGEDPWLNGEMGRAMVRGYQGASKIKGETNALNEEGNISSCVKHFAGYGSPEGGRDYDNVEISERTFREDYLPAYKAAIDEGSRMIMTSFNTWNRIPSTGNKWLLRDVLRGEMGFDGVIISDYGAVEEMVCHGIAEDSREATKLAIEAGVDIDMVSSSYTKYLEELVRTGEVEETLIDEAVMRILKLKNDLGLFENPYKDASVQNEKIFFGCNEHRELAHKMAAASLVLLKNEHILPLDKNTDEKIALIGPYSENKELYGAWSFPTKPEQGVSIKEGVEKKKKEVYFAQGSFVLDVGQYTKTGIHETYTQNELEIRINEAVELAKSVDKVVVCIGEHRCQSGECSSRTHITIPENQMELLRRVQKVNNNIITIVFAGRPLELKEITELSKAVIMAWWPGTEGGNAIADILFGDSVPEGKLTMSFPRTVGQIPVYYNNFTTGRPNKEKQPSQICTCYLDEWMSPLYSFGYGLSYTTFSYSQIELNSTEMSKDKGIVAKAIVTNTGSCTGTETVQLYLRDVKGTVVRPVKMLRGFKKIKLEPGESKEVSFEIKEDMLRFYNIRMEYTSEPGEFYVFIGGDSDTENMAEFKLI